MSLLVLRRVVVSAFFILHYFGVQMCRILFGVVEAGIETGGWTPDPPTAGFDRNPALLGRVSRASIDTSIDNLKRKIDIHWAGNKPCLSVSKLVSPQDALRQKLEARSRKLEKTSFEFPERASIRASTTLNENCTLGTLNFKHFLILGYRL